MTIFADATALIAIITGEAGTDELADALQADRSRLCSALSMWETVAGGLRRSRAVGVSAARAQVKLFLDGGRFQIVGIGEPEFELAADAYGRFGKGRRPAALNMGDCLAYACVRSSSAKLPYKGDDFTKTDLDLIRIG